MMRKVHTLELLIELRSSAGPELEILADENDVEFQERAKRWSDIDREVPAAIILPSSEQEIQLTVQWALKSSVPFVAKSGGHSHWSTIDDSGVVIDLSKYSGVDVDAGARTATLKGSVLSKQVAVALAKEGLFTALGNGNSIGVIPYCLGGGVSSVTSIIGFGSDQILSARMIDSKGDIVEVTSEQEPDLLWAIRGAGQFFGLVTELVIQAYPLSLLGNNQGVVWAGRFVFPLEQANEVTAAMEVVMNDEGNLTAGLMMIMAPMPTRKPAIVISGRYMGDPDMASVAFKPLYDLKPVAATGGPIPIQDANDSFSFLEAKGDYKRYSCVGLRRFEKQRFLKIIEIWKRLVADCPDAINTSFTFQWDSRHAKTPAFESAMSLHDTHFWTLSLIWYTDSASRQKVGELDAEAIATLRGPDESEYIDYQNATRSGPVEQRFRPKARLEKLKGLKKKWDPSGVFTTQLLD